MAEVNNLLHTYATKWLSHINTNLPIIPEHNEAKVQKLEALEKQFYARFGEQTYAGFIKKIRLLFANSQQDARALQQFQNDKLRSSLLNIEGTQFNPYSEKFEVSIKVNNVDSVNNAINKNIKKGLTTKGVSVVTEGVYTTTIELNREGFRRIAQEVFGSKTKRGAKSFKKLEEDLRNHIQNSPLDVFSFRIAGGSEQSFGSKEFLQSMERNARRYPWGFTKAELLEADKDPNERSKLKQELIRAREIIENYIFNTLLNGASDTLKTCAKTIWDQRIGNKFVDLSFFTTGGSTFMNGIIGALGEFQYAVFDLYITTKCSNLGVPDISLIGDKNKFDKYATSEPGKTDVEIMTNNGPRWGIQVKNYNLYANTERIATNIHPRQFVDLIDDISEPQKQDLLVVLGNAFFNLDYRNKYYNEDEIRRFIENNIGEMLSLEVSQQLSDSVAFYFIGGSHLVPASLILRTAIEAEKSDKFLSTISITGPTNILSEKDFHRKNKGENPIYLQYWHPNEETETGWEPEANNKLEFQNLITKSISIRSGFKFRELLNNTSIYGN